MLSTPSGMTVFEEYKPERGSEPSIEALSSENVQGECMSLRSADEALLGQTFLQHSRDNDVTQLKSEFDQATVDNQDGKENTENDKSLSIDGPH